MRDYKLRMTRPEFLAAFVEGRNIFRSIQQISELLPDHYDTIYCVYSAIMNADISADDIKYVQVDDEENIIIKLQNKAIAKQIKNTCKNKQVRLGDRYYDVTLKIKDVYVYADVKLRNPEALDHMITGLYLI